jgi:hypothetical protein
LSTSKRKPAVRVAFLPPVEVPDDEVVVVKRELDDEEVNDELDDVGGEVELDEELEEVGGTDDEEDDDAEELELEVVVELELLDDKIA